MSTTEEIFKKYSHLYQFEEGSPEYLVDKEDFQIAMIEFAKLHVQEALKTASEEAKVCKDMGELENGNESFEITECYYDEEGYPIYVEEDSILNAYPLTLIK